MRVMTFLLLASFSGASGTAEQLRAGTFDPPRVAPDFTLSGSHGTQLKLSAHRGKVVVLGFGYTSCPDVCPTTLAVLAQARRKLGSSAADVQVLYLTVDPEHDTPERMQTYLAAFDPTFIGGAGTPAQLAAVHKQYGITVQRNQQGGDHAVAHSSYVYLIDRKGRLRALMLYGRDPDQYVHDLKILLAE
jgi:protein SCO1